MQSIVYLLVVAHQCPCGNDNKESKEDIQHAELGSHQQYAIKYSDDAGEGGYLPRCGQTPGERHDHHHGADPE